MTLNTLRDATKALPAWMVSIDCLDSQDTCFTPYLLSAPYTNSHACVPHRVELLTEHTFSHRMERLSEQLLRLTAEVKEKLSEQAMFGPPLALFLEALGKHPATELKSQITQFLEGDKEALRHIATSFHALLAEKKSRDLCHLISDCWHTLCQQELLMKNCFPILAEAEDQFSQGFTKNTSFKRDKALSVLAHIENGLDDLKNLPFSLEHLDQALCMVKELAQPLRATREYETVWLSAPSLHASGISEEILTPFNHLRSHLKAKPSKGLNLIFEKMVRRYMGPSPLLAMTDLPEKPPKTTRVFEWLDLAADKRLLPVADEILFLRERQFKVTRKNHSPTLIEKVGGFAKKIFTRLQKEVRDIMDDVSRGSELSTTEFQEYIFGDN